MGSAAADRCTIPQSFWPAIEHLGLRPDALLRRARLPAALHVHPQVLTTAQVFALCKAVEELTADPGFGIKLIGTTDVTGGKASFLAAGYAADYRDGLARLARFKCKGTCEQLRFEERDGEFSAFAEWPYATEPAPAIATDVTFAVLLQLGRKGTGRHLRPIRVDFARSGPASDLHRDYFGCPVRYGAPRNMLVLASTDLDRPFLSHNAELLDILTPALTPPRDESPLGEQVKAVLKRRVANGRPEVAQVAQDLGLSERTLQRRITGEGTTFRALLTEARRELGRQLLSDRSIEIDEVACLLGYEDTKSFYRAFREWEGVTPSRWRIGA